MVGGGVGSFIGNVHRLSSRLDGNYDLVAGAFSSTAKKSLQSGLKLGIEKKRIYSNYKEMAKIESLREDKIEAVAIVTPNNSHSEIAIEFLKKNIHVICDKPLTATIAQAKKLASVAKKSKALTIREDLRSSGMSSSSCAIMTASKAALSRFVGHTLNFSSSLALW